MKAVRRLNGWQRIWVTLTGAAWLGFGILGPAYFALNYGGDWRYKSGITNDFKTLACADYISKPLSALREPPFGNGGTCWHIYTSRYYDNMRFGDIFPYTDNVYEANALGERWKQFGMGFSLLTAAVALGAAVVYGLGAVIAWVRRGFKDG